MAKRRTPAPGKARPFTSAYSDRELLDLLRLIAEWVDPEHPERVGAKQWTEARGPAGFPDAPSAMRVRERLRYGTWREALEASLNPGRHLDWVTTNRLREQRARNWRVEKRHVIHALQRVARYLGRETLTVSQYEYARNLLLQSQRRRRAAAPAAILTAAQIIEATGWAAGLRLAGLASPSVEEIRAAQLGIPIPAAIELCLHAHGALPDRDDLLAFRRANGFRMAFSRPPYAGHIAELRERRQAEGRWTPPDYPPRSQRPDYTVPVPNLDAPRTWRGFWNEASPALLEAMIEFLEWAGTDRRPTQLLYAEYHRSRPWRPPENVWIKHGGWAFNRTRARAERLARRRSANLISAAPASRE